MPRPALVQLDYTGCLAERVGRAGFSRTDVRPGVEAGKVTAYALMGRQGYEREAGRLRRDLARRRARA